MLSELDAIQKNLEFFRVSTEKKMSRVELQKKFLALRLSYKTTAVRTEYFNPGETKSINGPAILRTAPGITDKSIEPEGLQAIEQVLYADWTAGSHRELAELITGLQNMISSIQKE